MFVWICGPFAISLWDYLAHRHQKKRSPDAGAQLGGGCLMRRLLLMVSRSVLTLFLPCHWDNSLEHFAILPKLLSNILWRPAVLLMREKEALIKEKHLCSGLMVGCSWSRLVVWHLCPCGCISQTALFFGLATTWTTPPHRSHQHFKIIKSH